MQIEKLESTDAFLARDLPDVPAYGQIRWAKKILVEGAELLARSTTYQFAVLEKQISGISGGINAEPADRDAAIAAFVDELAPLTTAGDLTLFAGKGLTSADLAGLTAADTTLVAPIDRADLLGYGVALSADSVRPLDGRRIAIESMSVDLIPLVDALVERGAKVVALSTAKGSVHRAAGFDRTLVAEALTTHGEVAVEHLEVVNEPAAAFWEKEADILCCGSRTGLITHESGADGTYDTILPWGPVPVTAKALAALLRREVTVLPDFVSTAGPAFLSGAIGSIEEARATMDQSLPSLFDELGSHDDGHLLAACYRAEAYLSTWCEALPFGRPLA